MVVLEFTFLGFEIMKMISRALHGGWWLYLEGIKALFGWLLFFGDRIEALFGYNCKRVWRKEEEEAENGGYEHHRYQFSHVEESVSLAMLMFVLEKHVFFLCRF